MTIKFRTNWNGHDVGEVVSLPTATETLLVRGGLATYQIDAGGAKNSGQYRTSVVKAAVYGDSTASTGTAVSPDNQVIATHTAPFPASGATTLSLAPHKWMASALYPMLDLVGHYGVAGAMTSGGSSPIGMLDRDAQSASVTRRAASDMLNQAVDVVFYRGTSINNGQNLCDGTNTASVVQDCVNDHIKIVELLRQSGAPILDVMHYGYGGPNGEEYAAATPPSRDAVRDFLLRVSRELKGYYESNDQVFILDPDGVTRDPATGRYLSNCSGDHLHLHMVGQYKFCKARELPMLEYLFGKSLGMRFQGANLFSNPVFNALGSTPSYGTEQASGLTITTTGTGATRAGAQREWRDGKVYQVCDAVMTTAAGGLVFTFTGLPVLTTTFSANAVFGFEWDYFWEPVDGQEYPITSFQGKVDLTKTGNGRVVPSNDPGAGNYGTLTAGGISGKMRWNPFQITEANSALSAQTISHTFATTGVAGRWKVGVSVPRMVQIS
ncbi:hypothetical protein ACQE3E_06635 [Methylomonas sp. MED-D]|uniref:hypothetical protein n=1 Tax=Methylomonas sp. MED-D TaxID=3418768 RepID=UPI003CFE3800